MVAHPEKQKCVHPITATDQGLPTATELRAVTLLG